MLRHHRHQNTGNSRIASSARRGLFTDCVILIHDNAMPHSAQVTQQLIEPFCCEQMNHPKYSPNLAPSDFHLFVHLKRFLSDPRFDDDEEVKDAETSWLTSRAAIFCDAGVQNLVSRCYKCLHALGDYVERSSKVCESWLNMYPCPYLSV
ncbi:Histone-lysine N-methyltransferase SETMAR [Araneus ventricosus]|uniref:Histone-lysine N-methyltransferase SETMAR n=1 Tax=Araneus ventricosus TaxID=182803 RepID=A0A4Y2PDJ5_ARAVE|nr:Histone-lysine N-methyltransferase SETMAR [Araneus ventricosus]